MYGAANSSTRTLRSAGAPGILLGHEPIDIWLLWSRSIVWLLASALYQVSRLTHYQFSLAPSFSSV